MVVGDIALERELVRMQVSSRRSSVFVSVLMCIFPSNLQSESSASIFNISGYLSTVGFGVYETANFLNAQQYLFTHRT